MSASTYSTRQHNKAHGYPQRKIFTEHRCRHRHGARAPRVDVAERVRQRLDAVRREVVLVVQHRVVRRARRAEQARVRLEVEVELGRVRDDRVNHSACGAVAQAVAGILGVYGQEAVVVALRDNHDGDLGLDIERGASLWKA